MHGMRRTAWETLWLMHPPERNMHTSQDQMEAECMCYKKHERVSTMTRRICTSMQLTVLQNTYLELRVTTHWTLHASATVSVGLT